MVVKDFTNKKEFISEAKKLVKKYKISLKEAKYRLWYSYHNQISLD